MWVLCLLENFPYHQFFIFVLCRWKHCIREWTCNKQPTFVKRVTCVKTMGAGETANWTLCLQFTLTSLVSFERLANLKFISCFIFQQINTFHGVTSTYRRTKTWKTKTLPKIQIKRKEINTHTLTHKLSPTLCELNEMEENLINGLQDIKACTRRAFSSLWNRREEISFPCFQHIHFASWMCGAKNIFLHNLLPQKKSVQRNLQCFRTR